MSTTNAPLPNGGGDQANGSPSNVFTLLVGTFRSPEIYTLQFRPPPPSSSSSSSSSSSPASGNLTIAHISKAWGGHSWLALSPDHTRLYTTNWTDPPSVGAYAVDLATGSTTPLNTAPVASLSGYVTVSPSGRHLLSAGGPSGEVFRLEEDEGEGQEEGRKEKGKGGGRIGPLVQALSFRQAGGANDGAREGVAYGGFGGLRWGAHSVDISPDGRAVYVADIGHNCVWTYRLDTLADEGKGEGSTLLTPEAKHISPRPNDGPRHAWPHPNGRVLYVVQEHSGMVDAFRIGGGEAGEGEDAALALKHLGGETIMSAGCSAEDFWADEVRTSNLPPATSLRLGRSEDGGAAAAAPRWLYASTRGLRPETKGYVAAYELDAEGMILGPARCIFETRTSGGLANAVEPAPRALYETLSRSGGGEEEEYIALTDSEEGWVTILGWNGKAFREVAATRLGGDGGVVQAATAVWL
ncbi:putative isomerase YbhE [Cryphonectria parasitica EP155]|uniref:Isomerase YbhE n=1 Tax=Cryphonectria parasitica (strain ATCC 38755 / EP155) TaxID=660469 RepID=A0A9P5CSH9_CRYP1|nr:putative isomerase YbhE [Cryphonectria parasitica EP155]KAF3769624.1 putative isomerase YbhE [Cryphonectria parasitica EP155]